MKFQVRFDVTKEKAEKDIETIENIVLKEFAAAYINQFKEKFNYSIELEENEATIEGKKVKKTYANVSMDMINFKDVLKIKKVVPLRKQKPELNSKISKEKNEGVQ